MTQLAPAGVRHLGGPCTIKPQKDIMPLQSTVLLQLLQSPKVLT